MAYIDLNMLGIGKCNEQLFEDTGYAKGWNAVIDIIEKTPTADVVEVKHGEWVAYELAEDDDGYDYGDSHEKRVIWYKCSVCGVGALGRCYEDEWYSSPIRTDYCPNCGAKMDGVRKNDL
jgi:hypothetical protein